MDITNYIIDIRGISIGLYRQVIDILISHGQEISHYTHIGSDRKARRAIYLSMGATEYKWMSVSQSVVPNISAEEFVRKFGTRGISQIYD